MESKKTKLFQDVNNSGMRGIGQRRQNVFGAFLNLAHEVMHTESAFSPLNRELLGAYVSKKFGCSYCHLGHLETAIVLGGEDAKALVDQPTEELKIVFEMADKVVDNVISEQDVVTFLEKGYTEKHYEDIVFVCSLFGFANRMVTGFGLEYIASRDEAGSRYLANGYRFN
jgi:alkylhydroperoxidase family enzyme